MSEAKARCESCGMPIELGPYCTDERGHLQPFEERFERMVQWALRHEPGLSRSVAEERTRAYMKSMPAWRGRPKLA